jgi:hypothetical protein
MPRVILKYPGTKPHFNHLLHAVNATSFTGIDYDELEEKNAESREDLGAAGSVVKWRTEKGVIWENILKPGGITIITMAVIRIFEATDPSFTGRAR